MSESDWNYSGDINLREGGLFWQETGDDETVSAVRITPYKDAGGPDNLFRIEVGQVHVPSEPERRASALASTGVDAAAPTRTDFVLAFAGYGSNFDVDQDFALRIGRPDAMWSGRGEFPDPEVVLRSRTSLRKWVTREFLHKELEAAQTMGL